MMDPHNFDSVFVDAIAAHHRVLESVQAQQQVLQAIAEAMIVALRAGQKILWCGNGGSAADSQHLAAELVGRFRRERPALPSIALTTDTSILTAIGNDYGYEAVFARQVQALARPGDVLVGISTSGNSANVICALEAARAEGLVTVGFTGQGGGRMAALVDYLFAVDARDTARIQEMHILAGHMLCDWIELECQPSQAQAAKEAGVA